VERDRRSAPVRFTLEEAQSAWDGKFNCGPAAICAALNLTPDELRPLMPGFAEKGYTNPTLMFETLDRCKVNYRRVYRGDTPMPHDAFPVLRHGLVRIQFGGPWTNPGVPMRVRYRQTHWIAARNQSTEIFDAMCVGGWTLFKEWSTKLMPWLIRECYPKATGRWWPTHAIEILDKS
jgi:hypothetical protein